MAEYPTTMEVPEGLGSSPSERASVKRPRDIRARTHPHRRSRAVNQGTYAGMVTWIGAATSAARTSLIRKRSVVQVHVAHQPKRDPGPIAALEMALELVGQGWSWAHYLVHPRRPPGARSRLACRRVDQQALAVQVHVARRDGDSLFPPKAGERQEYRRAIDSAKKCLVAEMAVR